MEGSAEILIKNMVCPRCIKVVKESIEKIDLEVLSIQLGRATIKNSKGPIDLISIKRILEAEGFELLENKNSILVEKIKSSMIDLIYNQRIENVKIKFSDFISKETGKDYHYLSTVFSSVQKVTIERYFILQKIERAKELLSYNELSLGEIALKLGYSSISHFSNQFKRIIGVSPIQFRRDGSQNREFIDQLN